ncbi:hypothetical protein [Gillisia sp. JM1]|uniref:hypothetical protein n=1 Tax=Gillisia sp. JM1 TaxID=1283286 RepID=UPI00040113FE|nr:hypothetical protein [Gillisia sp. JM1]
MEIAKLVHEVEIDPLGLDTNNDEFIDTWNTSNGHKLLLPVGNYTLEYLAVTIIEVKIPR